MSPKEKARIEIDKKLEDAGWQIVTRKYYSPVISAVAPKHSVGSPFAKRNHWKY
jgi:hypothetical protein